MSPSSAPSLTRLGLLIPLAEEYLAIADVLPAQRSFQSGDELLYELSTPGGAAILAAVVGDAGQEHAAVVAERLIATGEVDVLAVVGIAGSLSKDAALGDVVVPTVTDLYGHSAKAVTAASGDRHELLLAGDPFRTDRWLTAIVEQIQLRPELRGAWADWRARSEARAVQLGLGGAEARAWSHTPTEVLLGHLASGSEVGASTFFVNWLKQRDRSYLAIEMEAGGVSVSAHRRLTAHPVLVVRGISDLSDERKGQLEAASGAWPAGAWRKLAAQNAADFLATLIDAGLLQPPGQVVERAAEASVRAANLPRPADLRLTGRAGDLNDLEAALDATEGPLAVTGLGGIGKTRLALELARRSEADRPLTWWVRAERVHEATADLAAAARALGLADDPCAHSEAVARLQSWCAATSGWLLVFDNATDPGGLRHLLPEGPGGVVITSTSPNWRPVAEPYAVGPLSTDESVALLVRAGGVAADASARDVAKALGGLPLALVQAGSYVQAVGGDWRLYRDELHARAPELFAQGRPVDYERTVSTTWSTSFDRIDRHHPSASHLFQVLAFVAPDDIPIALAEASVAQTGTGSTDVNDAIAALREFSFVDRQGTALAVHRVVQRVTRERARRRSPGIVGHAARAVESLIPQGLGSTTAHEWAPYVRHMAALLDNARDDERSEFDDVERCVADLRHGRLFTLAVELAAALVSAIERWGAADDRLVRALDALGGAQSEAGMRRDGLATRKRAIDLAMQLTSDPGAMIDLRGNHALAMVDGGDKSAAVAELRDILITIDELGGDAWERRAETLHNLGYALIRDGQHAEAVESLQQAVDVRREHEGPLSETLPIHLNLLGIAYSRLGQEEESLAALHHALRSETMLLGEKHERVAARTSTLGAAYLDFGHSQRALELLEEARRISVDTLAPDDPQHTLRDLWVAKAQLACGFVAEAQATIADALAALDALPTEPLGRRQRLEELATEISELEDSGDADTAT